jgi:type II secretory ATPase GspE/PulE/Tfp pilus assembly ATPase PilB-like protein
MKLSSIALVLALTGIGLSFQAIIAQQLPSYPLTSCPVSHEALGSMDKPVDLVHEGRLVRLCCKGCVKGFQKDPAKVLAEIDAAVIAAQKPIFPAMKCAISGDEIGADAIDMVYGTRLVRLCCKGCKKGFEKDPAAAMAKIDAALIAELKKTYPSDKCLVSGEKLEGEGFEQLYGVRLTRFCCEKCAKSFAKEPEKYLAALDKAAPKKN